MKYCPFCGKKLAGDFAFCPFCGKKQKESSQPNKAEEENDKAGKNTDEDIDESAGEEEAIKLHFDNVQEFIIYTQAFSPKEKVIWVSPDAYVAKLQEAFDLFEKHRFQETLAKLHRVWQY